MNKMFSFPTLIQNSILSWKYICFALIAVLFYRDLSAQCVPPPTDECKDENVLCSLDEVNGYCCQNTSDVHSDLYPCGSGSLCSSGGGPHNTSWWAFVTNGGSVTITITTTSCGGAGAGLQIGIWGDCNCGEEVACNPFCAGPGTITITANLTPCKTYYLFVDGCSGDVCDFCLTTSGGGAPNLSPLSNIMGKDKVCEGFCGERWSVPPQQSGCEPTYFWTVNGIEIGARSNELVTDDFWGSGTFQICVTAVIGNPNSGSTCDEEGPKCKTIEIKKRPVYKGADYFICSEDVPYDWHGRPISQSGDYSVEFRDAACCKYDSIRTFHVLPSPKQDSIYHIGCTSTDVYLDTLTKVKIGECQNFYTVNLPKSTSIYGCDSSYKLFALYPIFQPSFNLSKDTSNQVYIDPSISDFTNYCGNIGQLKWTRKYEWYEKSMPQKILDTNEIFIVKMKGDYCVEIQSFYTYGKTTRKCINIFCENLNEDLLLSNNNFSNEIDVQVNFIGTELVVIAREYKKYDQIKLYSGAGQKVMEWTNVELYSKRSISLPLHSLTPGIYYLEFKKSNKSSISKLLVL
ncbi:MAG: hypothetical protein IPQ10_14375 [Saprospiraceae bacterium]|nr:hypothetical protein [Saprospiraceae bacterium]